MAQCTGAIQSRQGGADSSSARSVSFSVVVKIIDVQRIVIGKAEHHSPVGANRDRPESFPVALERMEPESRQVHILNLPGSVEPRENVSQLLRVLREHPTWVVVLVKASQSLVTKRLNHLRS